VAATAGGRISCFFSTSRCAIRFNLRFEFVRGAAQFGEQTSGLSGDLRQLLRPENNQGQKEQEDRLGKLMASS